MLKVTPKHDGATYDADRDETALGEQMRLVWGVMADGKWHDPDEIEALTGINWSSASARLRDWRKPKWGSHTIERRHVPGDDGKRGYFEYRLNDERKV